MKHKSLIFLIFGLIILVVMIYFVGIDKVIYAFQYANLYYVLLAVLIEFLVYGLFTLRWQIINKSVNINLSFIKTFPMLMLSLAVNNITPSGRGGGEPVRAYVLTKETGKPFEETFATVIVDRAMDTLPFILLALLTIIGLIIQGTLSLTVVILLTIAVIIVVAVVFAIIYMSINDRFGAKVTKWLVWLLYKFSKKNTETREKRLVESIVGFQDSMRLMVKDKNLLYKAFPISFLIWILEISRVCIIFMAFGFPVSPIMIGEVFILSVLVGFIPVLPGGVGIIDGTMIVFFASAGIPSNIGAAATLVERLISFWMTTFIGAITIPYYGVNVLDGNRNKEEETPNLSTAEDKNEAVKNIKALNENLKK